MGKILLFGCIDAATCLDIAATWACSNMSCVDTAACFHTGYLVSVAI